MKKTKRIAAAALVLGIIGATPSLLGRQGLASAASQSGKDSAVIDLTGYWVSIVDEDWRWRMVTPAKGDYASIPLNAEGKKVADSWDLAKDEAEGNQCRPYGAAALMRLPTRLHVTWKDDNTLQIDTDAGTQSRLLHFDGPKWKGGEPTLQGDSFAAWEKQSIGNGYGPRSGGPVPGKGGTLHVVTMHMRPGYYRKNGVPYSQDAILTEYFNRVDMGTGAGPGDGNGEGNQTYLIVLTVVHDPKYLREDFITSEQFLREPDGAKWHPTPCTTEKPSR
ncbi:MAG: hypothetical protein ABSF78_11275 [Candidatus Acidiferrales bacterium]|jgi:hypothetical protein